MNNSNNRQEVTGYIGCYNLVDWWFDEFTEHERFYIEAKFRSSLIAGAVSLTQGVVETTTRSAVGFLVNLAAWLRRPSDRALAKRMLDKAEFLIDNRTSASDAHFLYGLMIEFLSKDYDTSVDALQTIIRVCEYQIMIASYAAEQLAANGPLPEHRGYRQLVAIREQQEDYREAMALCEQAMAQGWPGNWAAKIEAYRLKLEGSPSVPRQMLASAA